MATPKGTFVFCPVEGDLNGDFTVVTGMNYVGTEPPGELVAIVHEDGQEAVEAFMDEHAEELATLEARQNMRGA
jgi:hypothetical protein